MQKSFRRRRRFQIGASATAYAADRRRRGFRETLDRIRRHRPGRRHGSAFGRVAHAGELRFEGVEQNDARRALEALRNGRGRAGCGHHANDRLSDRAAHQCRRAHGPCQCRRCPVERDRRGRGDAARYRIERHQRRTPARHQDLDRPGARADRRDRPGRSAGHRHLRSAMAGRPHGLGRGKDRRRIQPSGFCLHQKERERAGRFRPLDTGMES